MANLIETYHRDIIWLLIAGLFVFGTIYFKDKWHAFEINKQNAAISALSTQYAALLAQKTEADKDYTAKIQSYQEEHNKLIALLTQKAVSPLAPLAPLPTLPVYQDLSKCNEAIKELQKDNNDCLNTVQSLQTDKEVDNKLITNIQDTVQKVDKENTEVKKDLTSETERKKAWRWTAIGGWALAILKFLI